MCDRIVRIDTQALVHMVELCTASLMCFVVLWIILISHSPMSSALNRIHLQLQDIQPLLYMAYACLLCSHYSTLMHVVYTHILCFYV